MLRRCSQLLMFGTERRNRGYTMCGPCQREWIIRIPDRYVSNGAVARKTMELGEMNLEVELEDEDQECIHH
uniref:Uncharacterized protein n=2 Tax=Loa loa TaxID=7209 RepID=A0A1I7W5T1_LOALO